MQIFSFLKKNKLHPLWSYSSPTIIWRILFDEENTIVVECRDQERKEATFFALEEKSGKQLWGGISFDEKWWIGIETASKGIAILHKYAQPDLPEHKGIFVVDIASGQLRWKNDELTFEFLVDDVICGSKTLFDKRLIYLLNLSTGEIKEILEANDLKISELRNQSVSKHIMGEYHYAGQFVSNEAEPNIRSIIEKETSVKLLVGEIEFLSFGNHLIITYYVRGKEKESADGTLENRLVIYDLHQRKRVFLEILNSNSRFPLPETFFIRNGILYYIKDYHQLIALKIQPEKKPG